MHLFDPTIAQTAQAAGLTPRELLGRTQDIMQQKYPLVLRWTTDTPLDEDRFLIVFGDVLWMPEICTPSFGQLRATFVREDEAYAPSTNHRVRSSI